MDRFMKYNEVKGIRFTLTGDKPEDEIILDEQYEYVKIEDLQGASNIAVYINDAKEDDYVILKDTIEFEDIAVKKIKVKYINNLGVDYTIQAILMR
ncbi:hypothetical protein [Clostridium saudiense]|uniref:hypothetical protein n=1 Tax=Clostridium saudiense TaxID=1414720 RepID=UPI0018AA1BF7|nr:hypothetical protein [Clostridium saudiense]